MGDRLRRGETAAADVIVLPEGGGPEAEEVKAVLLAFGRIRRCERRSRRARRGRLTGSLWSNGAHSSLTGVSVPDGGTIRIGGAALAEPAAYRYMARSTRFHAANLRLRTITPHEPNTPPPRQTA